MEPGTVQKQTSLAPEQVLELVSRQVGSGLFEMWFSHPGRIVVQDGMIEVRAESDFEVKRLQQNFGNTMRSVALQLLGNQDAVRFVVSDAEAGKNSRALAVDAANQESQNRPPHMIRTPGFVPAKKPSARAARSTAPDETAGPDSGSIRKLQFRLNDFSYAPNSEMLQTAVGEAIRAPGRFSPLFFHGPAGSGKTHLAESIVHEFRRTHRAARAVSITAEQFTNSFIQSVRGGGLPLFRRKFRDLDMLAVDDIHFLGGKRATLGEFQYTLDHLLRAGKQIVLTSDRTPMETSDAIGDFASRMTGGLVCQIGWPDQAGRERIVNRFALERGLKIEPEGVTLVASRISGDARRLCGAVNRVVASTLASGLVADSETVMAAAGDLMQAVEQQTSLSQIELSVCECMGVTSTDLRSSRRTRRISTARMLAMWLSRKHTSNALSEIGDHFGGRSHSTVVAAQKRVDEMMELGNSIELVGRNSTMRDAVQTLQRRLRVS